MDIFIAVLVALLAGVGLGTFVVRTALTKIAAEVRAEAVKEFDAVYSRYDALKANVKKAL